MNRAAAPPPSSTHRAEIRALSYAALYWQTRCAVLEGVDPDLIRRELVVTPDAGMEDPHEREAFEGVALLAIDDALSGREPRHMRTA